MEQEGKVTVKYEPRVLAAGCFIEWLGVTGQVPRIEWMNDSVYYDTNNMVFDRERNKTRPENSNFYYTKTVITTNKVSPHYFLFGDFQAELGAREDGVIVWRKRR